MYLVSTRMPGESYRRRLRSLLLCLCDVFRALINSLVCWFRTSTLGLVLFQIVQIYLHDWVTYCAGVVHCAVTTELLYPITVICRALWLHQILDPDATLSPSSTTNLLRKNLPCSLQRSSFVASFKSSLKTHLFPSVH